MSGKKIQLEVQLMEVVVPIVGVEPGDHLMVFNGLCVGRAPRSMAAQGTTVKSATVKKSLPSKQTKHSRRTRQEMNKLLLRVAAFCKDKPRTVSEVGAHCGHIVRADTIVRRMANRGLLKAIKGTRPLQYRATSKQIQPPASEKRSKVLALLKVNGSMTANELMKPLGVKSYQSVNFHLKKLLEAGHITQLDGGRYSVTEKAEAA